MPLQIIRQDITKMRVDAIVNAANNSLLGGGGVDGAIHRAAGPKLLEECRTLGGCETGDAKITGAYNLPCKYVIHTVGPIWRDGRHGERDKLASCYKTSLRLARDAGCETVAFPLISSGAYGYPKDQALRVAVDTISEFLLHDPEPDTPDAPDMTIYLVVFGHDLYKISDKLFKNVAAYIDDNYVDEHSDVQQERRRHERLRERYARAVPDKFALPYAGALIGVGTAAPGKFLVRPEAGRSLEDALEDLDESFTEMLLRKIDESGMNDVECYKRANIDRKLFSKIRSNKFYRPSKPTALAFAIALRLSLDETKSLLMKAGYALSRSSKFDVIIEYFIRDKCYDVFEINEALFKFDQTLLGAN